MTGGSVTITYVGTEYADADVDGNEHAPVRSNVIISARARIAIPTLCPLIPGTQYWPIYRYSIIGLWSDIAILAGSKPEINGDADAIPMRSPSRMVGAYSRTLAVSGTPASSAACVIASSRYPSASIRPSSRAESVV